MNLSFFYSVVGHFLIGVLFFVSFSTEKENVYQMDSVPVFIDLKNVEIAEKTNLPKMVKTKIEQKKKPEQKKKKEKTQKKEQKKKKEEKVTPAFKKKETRTTVPEVKPIQKKENIKDAATVQENVVKKEKKAEPQAKPKKKITPVKKEIAVSKKKIEVSKAENKKNQEDDMDSLFASVEKMKETDISKKEKKSQENVSDLISEVLDGVKNGQTETVSTKLTVSQIDFIAATVRKHWNLDAGVRDIDNMLIEIRVSLNRDGQVYDVEILNQKRYNSDSSFRSVAQSARRAIYICDKLGEESPFRILALKYPDSYSDWQKIQLRFNPLDGGVS